MSVSCLFFFVIWFLSVLIGFILDEFLINENQNMWLKRYVYVKVQEFEGHTESLLTANMSFMLAVSRLAA